MPNFEFQNPNNPAPGEILHKQQTIPVQHCTFDGIIKQGEIIVHRALAADVQEFFSLALSLQFPIQSVTPIHTVPYLWNDEISCEANNTSGFNFRRTPDGKKVSLHGCGLAFDVNPRQNPYIKYEDDTEQFRIPKAGTYDQSAPGTLSVSHPLVTFMKERGWTWGGDWTRESGRVDYQHFEKEVSE